MYMDDIKLFVINKNELETRIQTMKIYSQDIGMESDREKCAMLIMKSRKWLITEGIEQPDNEKSENSEERKPTSNWEY